ncbi:ATP-binding protein [Actinomadura sp. 21ATH]|uniref:ATP-binding protein n=1 Tax=Actinomadura sp. 21ATH TaxID=1735444 RepID=UPI0035BF23F4
MNELEKEVRFAGVPAQVRVARRFVGDALGDGHPCRWDAMLLASEVCTNAVHHSYSGRPGGTFLLNVRWAPEWVRVAVVDQGADGTPCLRRAGAGAVSGRGVALLDELSVRWGFVRRAGSATEVWFLIGGG